MTEYSHSRLSTFEDCPRKFRFRYVDDIKVDTEGVEAFMGKRVHEILERLYHHVARFGKPPSLAQVLDRFKQDWARAWHDKVTIVRAENPPAFRQGIGRALLLTMLQHLHEGGISEAYFNVLAFNTDAIAFYRALGARALGRQTNTDSEEICDDMIFAIPTGPQST